jgi:hypothetical protein
MSSFGKNQEVIMQTDNSEGNVLYKPCLDVKELPAKDAVRLELWLIVMPKILICKYYYTP